MEFDEFFCLLLKLDFYLAPAGFCPLVRARKLNQLLRSRMDPCKLDFRGHVFAVVPFILII